MCTQISQSEYCPMYIITIFPCVISGCFDGIGNIKMMKISGMQYSSSLKFNFESKNCCQSKFMNN